MTVSPEQLRLVNQKPTREMWEDRFVSSLEIPFSKTSEVVSIGIEDKLAPDTNQGRVNLARRMGTIMFFVFNNPSPNNCENFREDLDPELISQETGLPSETITLTIALMTDSGLIINGKERQRKQLELTRKGTAILEAKS